MWHDVHTWQQVRHLSSWPYWFNFRSEDYFPPPMIQLAEWIYPMHVYPDNPHDDTSPPPGRDVPEFEDFDTRWQKMVEYLESAGRRARESEAYEEWAKEHFADHLAAILMLFHLRLAHRFRQLQEDDNHTVGLDWFAKTFPLPMNETFYESGYGLPKPSRVAAA
jgi:hypothetical protein